MLAYVYVVIVDMPNPNFVRKEIQKRKVIKSTNRYVTVQVYGSELKFPASQCFADKEAAERECESRANELIAKLITLIGKLKKPVTAPGKDIEIDELEDPGLDEGSLEDPCLDEGSGD
jgi:hypothetical protein